MQSRVKGSAAVVAVLVLGASACGGSGTKGQPRQNAALAAAPASGAVEEIPEAAVDALNLERAKAKRVGTFRLRQGPHAVYVAPTQKGTTCVLDVGDVHVGAGCDAKLFDEHEIAWTEAFEGGPALATISDLHVTGVAAAPVRALSVELSNGERVSVSLNGGRAFMYEATQADIDAAVVPRALLAFDGDGKEIDRVELLPLPPTG